MTTGSRGPLPGENIHNKPDYAEINEFNILATTNRTTNPHTYATFIPSDPYVDTQIKKGGDTNGRPEITSQENSESGKQNFVPQALYAQPQKKKKPLDDVTIVDNAIYNS